MNRHAASGCVLAPAFGLLVLAIGGCGGQTAGQARYVPSVRSARGALEAALAAWQRGEPAGKIESASPPVEVVDTKRPGGEKLVRFEIQAEEAAQSYVKLTVRLTLETSGEVDAVYVVVGRDPIWVFGEADYAKMGGM